jgi:hypothetical protein
MQWFDGSHGASGHTLAHHDSHRVSHHETLDYPSSLAYIQDMRSERGVGVSHAKSRRPAAVDAASFGQASHI